MATSTTDGNPIVVTGTTAASEVIKTGANIFIKFIKWHKPTTIGHLCSLTDVNGKAIALFDCEVADQSQVMPIWTAFRDIYVDDMDSGSLYIYIE